MTDFPHARVLVGPPASGKSTQLLASLRAALINRDWSVRLLVPSATMAEHLRNQLSREGLVLRKSTVITLTRFVDDLKLSDPAPSPATLESLIANVLNDRCPKDYAEVATQPGFIRHLASAADSLALAGVTPQQLEAPLADVYARILKSLAAGNLALRGQRLQQSEAKLTPAHLTQTSKLLLDGFFSFANTEKSFLNKLSQLIPVELTIPESGTQSLRNPTILTLAATDRNHEALLIAHQVLALAKQGIDLRRIGILLRTPDAYASLIETTFARLAIPSRSYLGTPLSAHPVIAFHRAFLKAVDSGWDNKDLLSAMRWRFTGLGATPAGDQLEQQVRAALPASGLSLFPQIEAFAEWPTSLFTPTQAAAELKRLAALLEPPHDIQDNLSTAWLWHQRESACNTLHTVLDQTATALAPSAITLNTFWQAVESDLAGQTLHERDTRRNVVHIMDLFESRQWDLDYVFAPGMAEGEFPHRSSPDPLLNESLKKTLGMKTLEERQTEEHFLFEMLLTRASQQLILSYPRTNAKGDPVLPSLFLSPDIKSGRPLTIATPPSNFNVSTGQLTRNYRDPRPWSASEFETYLACPWKHFAARGLALKGLPDLPSERLNPILLGTVAHTAIKIWTQDTSRNIEQIGERELDRACRNARVPRDYNYERERINLLRNLRLYARNAPPIPAGWQAYLEQPFSLTLEDGPAVRGQIDRYDQSPSGEIHAYDYKYSKANNLDEKYPIQGALYAIALGSQVTRFSFVALREQARPAHIEGQVLINNITLAKAAINDIVLKVRSGLNPVDPVNPDNCKYCDFIDACRIRSRKAEEEEALPEIAEGTKA